MHRLGCLSRRRGRLRDERCGIRPARPGQRAGRVRARVAAAGDRHQPRLAGGRGFVHSLDFVAVPERSAPLDRPGAGWWGWRSSTPATFCRTGRPPRRRPEYVGRGRGLSRAVWAVVENRLDLAGHPGTRDLPGRAGLPGAALPTGGREAARTDPVGAARRHRPGRAADRRCADAGRRLAGHPVARAASGGHHRGHLPGAAAGHPDRGVPFVALPAADRRDRPGLPRSGRRAGLAEPRPEHRGGGGCDDGHRGGVQPAAGPAPAAVGPGVLWRAPRPGPGRWLRSANG